MRSRAFKILASVLGVCLVITGCVVIHYYNQFSGTGDLSHVTQVKVSLNTGADARVASDYILDEIKTTTVPASIDGPP